MVTYPALPIDCDFERDFCTWESDQLAEFQWLRHMGSTPTENTGPQIDRNITINLLINYFKVLFFFL